MLGAAFETFAPQGSQVTKAPYPVESLGCRFLRLFLQEIIFQANLISLIPFLNASPPVFKDYDIYVHGKRYFPYEFLKFLRKTTDGSSSVSVLDESMFWFHVSEKNPACLRIAPLRRPPPAHRALTAHSPPSRQYNQCRPSPQESASPPASSETW